MNTVANTLNPSFWVGFMLESPPFGGSLSITVSKFLIMGIQCVVTALFAIYIAKWNRKKIWVISYFICIPIFLLLRYYEFPETIEDDTYKWYLDNYHYCAFPIIVRYSIIQIVYVILYVILSSIMEKHKHSHLLQEITKRSS
jgi:hypothetical protein